jgi:hypothetical protein
MAKEKMVDAGGQDYGYAGSAKPVAPPVVLPRELNEYEYINWDSTSTAPLIRPQGYNPGSAYGNDLGNFLTLSREMSDGDPLWENMIEFVDMTGAASYDDAWRAYTDYKKGDIGEMSLMLEGVGALPIVGKIKKIIALAGNPNATTAKKAVAKAMNVYGKAKDPLEFVNKYDAMDDIVDDNLLNTMKKKNKDPLAQAAQLLNENAPKGESLAYINSEEADVLKELGGAGVSINSSGIPSYFSLPKFSVGKSAKDYVGAMADPDLQNQLLEVRQQYDPKYQDLQMSLAKRAADPMADLAESNAMRAQEFGAKMAERQAGSDISMLNRFGADLNEAMRASDPLMQARVEQMNKVADDAFQESQMQNLSPEMRRRATQSAREGLTARGRGMDNAAIAAEAMSREDYLRDIVNNARGQVQSLGTTAGNFNRATGMDPLMMTRGGGNYTQQGFGERSALFGIPQEQMTRINPDAGVNIGMQAYANRANAMANAYAADKAADASLVSGLLGFGGALGGGFLAGR